jgi:radical SAM superfamily enzyme YgiQ (UPF0313 family)
MTVLLLSGRGPEFKNSAYFTGSMFDPQWTVPVAGPLTGFDLRSLEFVGADGVAVRLLRPRAGRIPFLVTYALESLLYMAGEPFESFHLDHVWTGAREPDLRDPEAVLLSTTFICNRQTLTTAIGWVTERFPGVPLVVGGQYSNLKFAQIMSDHPAVSYVVRGDGELATPMLLAAIRGRGGLDSVPNLVWRDASGTMRVNATEYVDLESYPAPQFPGQHQILPYESMRGCPFSCRFCSYPHASPQWRHKSAKKVRSDWMGYRELNGVEHIQALDSTFTVPKPRLRELLPMLADAPFTWEAYTRANALHDADVVRGLEQARCTKLSIGFESMSANTLEYMHKQVRVAQNRTAHELLRDSSIWYRVSYMVGYPGETPEDFELTQRFIVDEYTGHFMLSVFSFTDETMPVWQDAERFALTITDPVDPDYNWAHAGMDVATGRALQRLTLDEARWGSDGAVLLLWQPEFELPLMPGAERDIELRLEKTVERLAMLPVDFADRPDEQAARLRTLLGTLARYGVHQATAAPVRH